MIHALLEHLPATPAAERDALATALLAPFDAPKDEVALCLAEATALLAAPNVAHLFTSDALAEVALSGTWQDRPLWGVIDRLLIAPDRLLAVDFKTNRIVPDRPEDVPEGLLRQLGAYLHLLTPLYPNHRIDAAILWTATARLMPLEPVALSAALNRAALDPAVGAS
jgi:ATP-dependent helicase/nuclease subunit A